MNFTIDVVNLLEARNTQAPQRTSIGTKCITMYNATCLVVCTLTGYRYSCYIIAILHLWKECFCASLASCLCILAAELALLTTATLALLIHTCLQVPRIRCFAKLWWLHRMPVLFATGVNPGGIFTAQLALLSPTSLARLLHASLHVFFPSTLQAFCSIHASARVGANFAHL